MAQGKRVVLKDQVLVMTEELYEKLKQAEEKTRTRKRSSGHGRKPNAVEGNQMSTNNSENMQEES